jgi:anti-sigma factor RsiW
MTSPPAITDEEIHAYIDGELGEVRTADITALSQYDAELAARIAAFRADKAKLQDIYGPLIARPLPPAWLHTIDRARASERKRPQTRALFAMAASIALLVMAGLTYALLSAPGKDAVVANALSARHDSLVMTAAAGTNATQEVADRTVQGELGTGVKAPDLRKLGYTLAGAHAAASGKGVTIDYRDDHNRMFTIYLQHSPGDARFDMLKRGATRICVWQDDVLSAVMMGDMSAPEMLRLATLAYAGLEA